MAGGPEGEGGGGGGPKRTGFGHSRLDAATLSYYEELSSTFAGLEDPEDRQLAADNALGEANIQVACDAACSRVVEALLPAAGTPAVCAFAAALTEGENLGLMCTRWGRQLSIC